jgi:hypothetical protein
MRRAEAPDRRSELGDNGAEGLAPSAPKYAVLIPTTSELLVIRGLVERHRLPRSHAVIAGDFRSLAISADFHQLVTGPLQPLHQSRGAVELRLSGDIDSGRSWELPVSLAHIIAAHGRLVGDTAAADIVVWATGAIDSELALVDDDYDVARKIETSLGELRRLAAAGKDVRILLPASVSMGEAARLSRCFDELPVTVRHVASVAGGLREIGAPSKAEPAAVRIPRDTGFQEGPASFGWGKRRLLVLLFGLSAAGVASSLSILGEDGEGITASTDMIQVLELHAADRGACIAAVMAGEQLPAYPSRSTEGGFLASGNAGLCGLRFANAGRKPLRVSLDSAFQAHTIAGGNPLFQGLDLDAGRHIDLLFAKEPTGVETTLAVDDEGRAASFRLRIERGTE